jgi:hypothetical protein
MKMLIGPWAGSISAASSIRLAREYVELGSPELES